MQRDSRRTLSVPSISYEDVDQQQQQQQQQPPQPSQHQQQHQQNVEVVPGLFSTPPPGTGASAGAGWPPQQQQSPSLPMGTSLGKSGSASRSRSASTSSLATPTGPPLKKKIVTACQRCRTRKIRCDGALPACKSCVKAGVDCIEVDRSGDNNMPRSHVLELENRIKWLEDIVSSRCPDVDLAVGPPVELRSRPSPPAIRIVTTGPDFNAPPPSSLSSSSSPVFALSPASTCATPVSFEFSSPGVSPGYLQPMSPFTFSDAGASPAPSPGPSSPLLVPQQDAIAHEVGLLSLSASEEPKYVGTSSGIAFARMVFADTKDSDFYPADVDTRDIKPPLPWGQTAEPAQLPNSDELVLLAKSYFETTHQQYPFLHRPTFDTCLEAVYLDSKGSIASLPAGFNLELAQFHVFLVLSIGANILSTRLGHPWNSEGYFASAMQLLDKVSLTGSVQGVQSALLLAMRSLHVAGGWNIWYLNAVIMAACIDLGFHRKIVAMPGEDDKAALKRRVYWSAYSLDRNLGVALGRPFVMRDESIDVEFPQESDNDDEIAAHSTATQAQKQPTSSARATFAGSIYLFRMIKIISGVTTTLHRVARPTGRWQGDLPEWQQISHRQLTELRDEARITLGGIRRGSGTGGGHLASSQMLELKYHEAVQQLFRPSPVFPKPTAFALQQCFNSAIETIRIYIKLKRFGEMPYTWLTAHAVFLAGITMVYAHRHCREVQSSTTNEVFTEDIRSCSSLLADLAQRWRSAQQSRAKFDALAQSALVSAHANAARMLSPHDGARRASGSHTRVFPEIAQQQQSQTLEVPTMGSHTGLVAPNWYGTGAPGGIVSGESMSGGIGWMDSLNWGEMQPEPMLNAPMEDMPVAEGVEGMLTSLMGEDTAMWDMDPTPEQQR